MTLFNVAHKRLKLKVCLLPTVAHVDAAYRQGWKARRGTQVHAYFYPAASTDADIAGTVVLPLDGCLDELVPHEVTHAVIHYLRGVSASDDEAAATAVGMLSAKIFKRIKQHKTAA
jgi:hypothetical protein